MLPARLPRGRPGTVVMHVYTAGGELVTVRTLDGSTDPTVIAAAAADLWAELEPHVARLGPVRAVLYDGATGLPLPAARGSEVVTLGAQ